MHDYTVALLAACALGTSWYLTYLIFVPNGE